MPKLVRVKKDLGNFITCFYEGELVEVVNCDFCSNNVTIRKICEHGRVTMSNIPVSYLEEV